MRVNKDNSSNAKQYVEKDNLVLVENDEMMKLQVYGGQRNFRFNTLFEVICNLLELKDCEICVYYTLLYTREKFRSFRDVCLKCAQLFGRNYRTYHKFIEDMIRRGIIKTDYDNNVFISKEYDLKEFKGDYLIIKLN